MGIRALNYNILLIYMSKIFYTNIDLKKNQLENARIHNVTEFPSSPVVGQIVYLTAAVSGYTANNLYMYNGSDWVCCVKKGNITGGNEILIGSAADTATGSGITIANSTTGLAPSSDITVPTSKAVADYVGSLAGGITYKGTIGVSPATVQTLPTTGVHVGDAYAVATAGTYSPLTTPSAVGDLIICNGVNGSTVSWTNVPVDFIVDNKAATIALGDSNFTTIATIDGKDVTLKVEGIEAAAAQGSTGNVITGITASGNDITYTMGTAVTTITGTANSGVVTNISQSGDTVTVTSADLATDAPTGTHYITSVSQASNGKITVNGGTFETTIPSSNPSTSNAPTTSAVKTYVDDSIAALDGSATIASVSNNVVTLKAGVAEVDGVISNSTGSDITLEEVAVTGAAADVSTTAIDDGQATPTELYPAGTVQGTLEAIARNLASATSGAVNGVTIDGTSVVSNHIAALVSDANSAYDASTNKLATVGTVTNAINALDVSTDKGAASISGSAITINAVQQEDGLIKDGGTTTINLDGTYDASTNKIATQSTVTNALDALDGTHNVVTIGSYTPQTGENATQKIEFFDATQSNGAISTDGTASDTLYLSQAVTAANPIITKDDLSGIVGAMVYKGAVNSDSDLPTTGVQAGWTYVVATAGTYAGQACEVGDMIIAKDSTPTWNIINGENQVTNAGATITAGDGSATTIATVDGTAITAKVSVTAGTATIASKSGNTVTLKSGLTQTGTSGTIGNDSGTDITLADVAATGAANELTVTSGNYGGDTATTNAQTALNNLAAAITSASITIDGHVGAITTGAGLTDVAADGGSFGINIDLTNANGLYIDANNNTLAMHIADESTASGANFGTVKVTNGNGLTISSGVISYAHNTTAITVASESNGVVTINGTLTPDASDAITTSGSITLAKIATTGAAADVSIADSGSLITATNVEDALQELATRTTASANVFSGSKAVAVGGTMTIALTPVTGGSVTALTDAAVSVRDSAGNEVECDKAYGSSGATITLTFYNNTSETFYAVVTTKNNVASITVS